MKKLFVSMMLLASIAKAQHSNVLSIEERKENFKLLFNGHSLKGWHSYLSETAKDAWKVDSGAIHLSAKGGGDLVTAKDYKNFDLRWEWKLAKGGNSGLFYHVLEMPEYKTTYLTGTEYQILDNEGHSDGALPSHRVGSVYDLIAAPEGTSALPMQWHTSRVVVKDTLIQHYLNDKLVASYNPQSPAFKNLIAASKFKSWKGFASSNKGKIALQDHGDQVWFRNLRIKEFK